MRYTHARTLHFNVLNRFLALPTSLRNLLSYPLLVVRVQALRALRFMARDAPFVRHVTTSHAAFMIARSLEREKEGTPERIQAFKAVNQLIQVGSMHIPRAIAAVLVAIAESVDDPFCTIALETLCTLGMRALFAYGALCITNRPILFVQRL
jgi:hypothetical protein